MQHAANMVWSWAGAHDPAGASMLTCVNAEHDVDMLLASTALTDWQVSNACSVGAAWSPPKGSDGTPSESANDLLVRMRQVLLHPHAFVHAYCTASTFTALQCITRETQVLASPHVRQALRWCIRQPAASQHQWPCRPGRAIWAMPGLHGLCMDPFFRYRLLASGAPRQCLQWHLFQSFQSRDQYTAAALQQSLIFKRLLQQR